MTAKRMITTAALTLFIVAGSAAAQTTTTATGTNDTPGTPNTGSGGSAPANILMLTGSAAVALAGIATLMRRRTH